MRTGAMTPRRLDTYRPFLAEDTGLSATFTHRGGGQGRRSLERRASTSTGQFSDSGLAHLSDGVAQELITQFGRMDRVRQSVAARTTVQP